MLRAVKIVLGRSGQGRRQRRYNRRMRALLGALLCAIPTGVAAQAAPAPQDTPPAVQETVDVVAVTPLHGSGLPRLAVPSNVQVVGEGVLSNGSTDLAALLASGVASLAVSEAQGGTFQPDLLFRGFTGSPLLGASEGIAVYQDGVRSNEPFGDVVNWDALPPGAIDSVQVMPGANPLFGLNTLGGAISIRTRDGFDVAGGRAAFAGGAFGRIRAEADWGASRGPLAAYVATSWLREDGWRDYSPSRLRRVFGKVSWRGQASRADVNATFTTNDLLGNGTVPAQLLQEDWTAVFTHPDRTDHDLSAFTVRLERQHGTWLRTEAVAYFRPSRIATLNGDAGDDDDDDDAGGADEEAGSESEMHEEGDDDEFDGVLNRSRTRTNAAGGMVQVVATRPARGRFNQFIAGAAADLARTDFGFGAEYAMLSPTREAIGVGVVDPTAAVDLDARKDTYSLFVSDTVAIAPRTHLTGSARLNWTTVTLRDRLGTSLDGDHRFTRLNPAAGITFDATSSVNLYGGYSQSSRVPTPVELTCADPEDPCRLPNSFVSDPPLAQVVAGTWEAGARGRRGVASWSVAAFATRVRDDVIFVSSGTMRGEGHFENVASTRRAGIESSMDVRLGRVDLAGAYTWQRATFGTGLRIASPHHPEAESLEIEVDAGDHLPGVPSHIARLGAAVRLGTRVDVAGTARMQSSHYLRGDEANLLAPLPGFTVLDARVRWKVQRRMALVAQASNILDSRYATFGALAHADLLGDRFEGDPRFHSPGAPRAAWLGVEFAF